MLVILASEHERRCPGDPNSGHRVGRGALVDHSNDVDIPIKARLSASDCRNCLLALRPVRKRRSRVTGAVFSKSQGRNRPAEEARHCESRDSTKAFGGTIHDTTDRFAIA